MGGDVFLDSYAGQSVAELIALEDTHRVDSLVLAFESAIDAKREAGKGLSDVETVVLAVEAMEREVNNGGFSQFFYNSSAAFAPVLVDALTRIDCPHSAALASAAIASLDLDTLDADAIENRMDPDDDELERELGELDDRYYDAGEAIADRLFEFIKKNSQDIQLS